MDRACGEVMIQGMVNASASDGGTHAHLDHEAGRTATWAMQIVWLVDLLILATVVGVVVLSGTNPLDSPMMTLVIVVGLILAPIHHVWYRRHREEIEHDPALRHDRERRGF